MNCVLIIERNGFQNAVKLSFKDTNSISVGRSWQSDVIVADQYVDSEHLKISANDDQFSIEDLGSANGTKLKRKVINSETSYEMGSEISLGETTLRLINEKSTVAPAVKYQGIDRLLQYVGILKTSAIATALICLSYVATQFLGQSHEVTTASFFHDALQPLSLLVGYTFFAGCLSLLFRLKHKFLVHWTLICTYVSIILALDLLGNIIKFNFNSSLADSLADQGSVIISMCLFLYVTLSLTTKTKTFRKNLWIALVCLSYLAFNVLIPMSKPDHEKWSSRSTVRHTGQTPNLFFGKTRSLQEHIESSEGLFIKLDKQLEP